MRLRISLAGSKNSYPRFCEKLSGFTLIEVLIVLAIIGLSSAIIFPAMGKGKPQIEIDSAVRKMTSVLKLCRSEAIAKSKEAVFTLEIDKNRYSCDHSKAQYYYFSDIRTKFTTTSKGVMADKLAGKLFFYPDGSSSGGEISLQIGKLNRHLIIDWLIGSVKLRNEKAQAKNEG